MTMMAMALVPGMAAAQQAAPVPSPAPAPQAEDGADEPDIIVRGTRNLPGAVIGDITPEQQLSPADIRSYGVSSIADLLTELAPQTRSGVAGAPVLLLNGKRIAGFQEIRDIPTEAIARVDILPEEVALKYGYRADQRVVNFVLRRRFRAVTAELADRVVTDGGRNAPQATLDLLNIRNNGRLNVHTDYQQASALTENERNIAAQTGSTSGGVDQRPFRTLLPRTQTLASNLVYARPIGAAQATFNAEVTATNSRGQFGLPSVTLAVPAASPFAIGGTATSVTRTLDGGDFLPLSQRSSSVAAHLAASATGTLGGWQYYLGTAYDRTDGETFTETGVDATAFQARLTALDRTADPRGVLTARDFGALAANRGTSTSSLGGFDGLLNGSLFNLPAGPVSASIRFGAQTSDFTSLSYRAGVISTGQVSRDRGNGQLNLDLPIASKGKGVLPWLGTLSLNGNAAIDQLSDFGTLTTIGYGANWTPVTGLRFIASVADQDEAPTAQQLGNPQLVTPNVRVFDYVAGTTAIVTTVSGGNPSLIADNRHVAKVGLTLKPWSARDLTFIANYVNTRVEDPIASFPAATSAIAAAFPDRFTRDASGQLLRLDTRPINFARTERSELRYGFDFSVPLKSKLQKQLEAFRAGTGPNPFAGLRPPAGFARPGGEGAAPPTGVAPGGGEGRPGGGQNAGGPGPGGGGFRGGGFGGGGFGGGGRGQGGGRLQFALYHTWHLTDQVLVTDGGPRLDLLRGDTIGNAGGQSRHELEGQAGYSNNGLGTRLSINWRSATQVNGGTAAAPQQLNFGALGTANLRLFADLGQRLDLLKAHPWLRGTRVTLGLENLLDTRQRVTDAAGATPVNYQPDLIDPLGRTVRLSVRKLFF